LLCRHLLVVSGSPFAVVQRGAVGSGADLKALPFGRILRPLHGESEVRVEVESCAREGDAWRVRWRVFNSGLYELGLSSAWIPHGRFRGASGRTPLSVSLAAGASTTLSLLVRASEPPGTVVENAFLIVSSTRGRIFVRMRIEFRPDPVPIVEAITHQPLQS